MPVAVPDFDAASGNRYRPIWFVDKHERANGGRSVDSRYCGSRWSFVPLAGQGHLPWRACEMAFVSAATEPQGPLNAEIDLVKKRRLSEGPTSNAEEVDDGGLGIAGWHAHATRPRTTFCQEALRLRMSLD